MTAQTKNFYDFKLKSLDGKAVSLKDYAGKVVLVVNTASKCGLTPQYEGLETLYKTYAAKNFVILGFPCNQFMGQEPGTAEEIQKFCSGKYNITFPLFEKIEVNGKKTHPLYVFLKQQAPLEGKNDIRWNFEKFLIDRNGKVVKRYAPTIKPKELTTDIEKLL
ncbi:MAG: glutathione peroxidase [Porphyromonadaceae bacterium CG2_30_38_12]|nr:MAG: glutathione peroxidase [Porphyromonadaceae bacterium CG2_30_38_12]